MTNQPIALFDAINASADGAHLKMTSLELAEVTGKRHDNVKRTIEALVFSGVISHPQFEEVKIQRERREESVGVFVFSGQQGRLDSITVVAQLDPAFTAALVKRWDALETGKAKPAMVSTKPAPNPMLPEACNAIVTAVGAGVMPKKDGAELIRAITLASFHGSDVLFAASKRPTIERAATPAPQIQLALPNGKTPVALSSKDAERAKDAKSMTNLLKEHGYTHLSAQNAYLALAKAGMVLRGFKDGGSKGEPYWIIVGDGLLYGQNVARENKTAPYWYDSTFASLATLSGFPTLNLEAARKKGLATSS